MIKFVAISGKLRNPRCRTQWGGQLPLILPQFPAPGPPWPLAASHSGRQSSNQLSQGLIGSLCVVYHRYIIRCITTFHLG